MVTPTPTQQLTHTRTGGEHIFPPFAFQCYRVEVGNGKFIASRGCFPIFPSFPLFFWRWENCFLRIFRICEILRVTR